MIAYHSLPRIAAIHHLDNELSDLTPAERKKYRQITTKTLMEAYFAWLKSIRLEDFSSDKTQNGISYSLNHEKAQSIFLEEMGKFH